MVQFGHVLSKAAEEETTRQSCRSSVCFWRFLSLRPCLEGDHRSQATPGLAKNPQLILKRLSCRLQKNVIILSVWFAGSVIMTCSHVADNERACCEQVSTAVVEHACLRLCAGF